MLRRASRRGRSCGTLQPTIREFDLPREPFLRLIEANRIDQRSREYETWDDVQRYCVALGRPGRAARARAAAAGRRAELVAASDDVCTGLQLVNFLQDVPRDLELGRIYLPAEDRRRFGVTELDRPSDALRALLRFEAERARGAARARASCCARGSAAGSGGAVGLFARGGLRARRARGTPGWDVFTQRPRPSRARLAREAASSVARAHDVTVEQAVRGGRAAHARAGANFAYGIMVLPRPKRRAIAAIYAFARRVDDIADGDAAGRREARAARGAARSARRAAGRRRVSVALADARARYPIPRDALHDLVDGGLQDLEQHALRRPSTSCAATAAHVAGAVGVACIGGLRRRPAAARGDARDRPAADQHHARRRRGLAARPRLPAAGRARRVRRLRGRHRRGRVDAGVAGADGLPGARARAHLDEGLRLLALRSTGAARAASRRSRASTAATLERIEASGFDVFERPAALSTLDEAARRRREASLAGEGRQSSAAGSPGLAAALELVDAGHEVTLYEARPTLGGAVQTLPERDGDPPPPPDNGQHIALGCFTEYLRFLDRDRRGSARTGAARLALPVIAEDGRVASIGAGAAGLLALPASLRSATGSRVARALARIRRDRPRTTDETSATLLRRLGSDRGGDRPLLGRLHPAGPEPAARTRSSAGSGSSRSGPRCSAPRAAQRPRPADRAARRDARRRGRPRRSRRRARPSGSNARVESPRRARRRRRSSSRCRPRETRAPARRARARRSRTRRSSASICSSTGRSSATRSPRCSAATRTGCSIAAR